MESEHTFYDYIDGDGNGTNVIHAWLCSDGKEARAHFNFVIDQLEGSPPPRMKDSVWGPPFVKPLEGGWKGFIELARKVKRKQYRLVGMKQDRSVFLVTWGYHDGQGWHTDITPGTAKIRVNQMVANPGKYRREHEV